MGQASVLLRLNIDSTDDLCFTSGLNSMPPRGSNAESPCRRSPNGSSSPASPAPTAAAWRTKHADGDGGGPLFWQGVTFHALEGTRRTSVLWDLEAGVT